METTNSPRGQINDDAEARQLWEKGVEAATRGEWPEVAGVFTHLADNGYAEAAFVAAHVYERGPGTVARDLAKAEALYGRAVQTSNNTDARFHLAKVILRNRDAPVTEDRIAYAFGLLEGLVNDGYNLAALGLGIYYEAGEHVPKDLDRAERYYKIAADQGFVFGLVRLGSIAWAKRKFFRAVGLRLTAMGKVLFIILRNPNDPRLSMMHKGYKLGDEAFPGWHDPKTWPHFG